MTNDYTTSFAVEQSPEEVFDAVNDVRGWWSGEIDGRTDTLGAEFTYRYRDLHATTQRITEWVPGKKVVWHVLDSHIDFVKDRTEWNGTDIVFEISRKADKTELRFTHVGLVPAFECYGDCSHAWSFFRAYRSLDTYDDSRPLAPWLFRIAHNQCLDFIRRRGVRAEAEFAAAEPDFVAPHDVPGASVGPAIEHLVLNLPPKERACVLLKDVFDYSLEEIAELVDSTVGGVKAALNRGRSRLASLTERTVTPRESSPQNENILRLYIDRFNRQDWDGLRELISADAQLLVADRYAGSFADGGYLGVYSRMRVTWRLALGDVDGESGIVLLQSDDGAWAIAGVIRVEMTANGRIQRIADYQHCPWVLTAGSIIVREPASRPASGDD